MARKHSLIDQNKFTADLDKAYDVMERELRKPLDGIDYVATTADVWAANNESFIGGDFIGLTNRPQRGH